MSTSDHDVYVRMTTKQIHHTETVVDGVHADLDADQELVGIELLDATDVEVDGHSVLDVAGLQPRIQQLTDERDYLLGKLVDQITLSKFTLRQDEVSDEEFDAARKYPLLAERRRMSMPDDYDPDAGTSTEGDTVGSYREIARRTYG